MPGPHGAGSGPLQHPPQHQPQHPPQHQPQHQQQHPPQHRQEFKVIIRTGIMKMLQILYPNLNKNPDLPVE